MAKLDSLISDLRTSWLICDCVPIGSMYGIFNQVYHKNESNAGKYAPYMDPVGFGCEPAGFANLGL